MNIKIFLEKFIPYLILILVSFITISKMGADSKLYFGLGNNLLNGISYVDNIRNDEILPPIGFPFLIMIANWLKIKGTMFMFLLLSISFLILIEAFKNLKINLYLSLTLIFILYKIVDPINLYGIEIGILFSLSLLLYALTLIFKYNNFYSYIFFSFVILFSVMIRPILLPYIIFISPILIYHIYKYKFKIKKYFNVSLISFFSILLFVSILSYSKYKDNRYVFGTYSAIPLYCAWNKYINLESVYYSSAWSILSPDIKKEALAPLNNKKGWKERDVLLKKKVIDFIFKNPYKALKGFLWRLSKYTFNSDNIYYNLLFLIWFLLSLYSIFNVKKYNKLFIFIVITIPIYIVFIKSFFVYVGQRYLLDISLYLIGSLVLQLYYINNLKRDK